MVDPVPLQQINDPVSGKRYYLTPEGQRYQSVTSFLSELPDPILENWKKRMGKKAKQISEAAAGRGSRLHSAIESYLRNEEVVFVDPQQRHLFVQVRALLDNIDNIRMIESRMYSDRLKLAGQVDCIADFRGKLSVIDFKTSTRPKPESWISDYFSQTSAYAKMYEEHYGEEPEQSVIIMAVQDQQQPILFIKDMSDCFELFKNYARELHQYRLKQSENRNV